MKLILYPLKVSCYGGHNRRSFAIVGLSVLGLAVLSTIGLVPSVYAASTDLSVWCVSSNGAGLSYDTSTDTCTVNTSGSHVIMSEDVTISNGEKLLIPTTATPDMFGNILFINSGVTLVVDKGGDVNVAEIGTGTFQGSDAIGIENAGTIVSSGNFVISNAGGLGILAGHFFNFGTIAIQNTGTSTGIYTAGYFANAGTISVANSGTNVGLDNQYLTSSNNGTFINPGTIDISGSGAYGFQNSGTVNNTGSIAIFARAPMVFTILEMFQVVVR